MTLLFIERIKRRSSKQAEDSAAPPQCVRCGRKFVASGLDDHSRCWWCVRSMEAEEPESPMARGSLVSFSIE